MKITRRKSCRVSKFGKVGETYYYPDWNVWGFRPVNGIGAYGLASRGKAKEALLETYKDNLLDNKRRA